MMVEDALGWVLMQLMLATFTCMRKQIHCHFFLCRYVRIVLAIFFFFKKAVELAVGTFLETNWLLELGIYVIAERED